MSAHEPERRRLHARRARRGARRHGDPHGGRVRLLDGSQGAGRETRPPAPTFTRPSLRSSRIEPTPARTQACLVAILQSHLQPRRGQASPSSPPARSTYCVSANVGDSAWYKEARAGKSRRRPARSVDRTANQRSAATIRRCWARASSSARRFVTPKPTIPANTRPSRHATRLTLTGGVPPQ